MADSNSDELPDPFELIHSTPVPEFLKGIDYMAVPLPSKRQREKPKTSSNQVIEKAAKLRNRA
jgi:hypothetical protein